jgi:hypothetical protein
MRKIKTMTNILLKLKRLFCKYDISKSLPDHYAGELNTKRIRAYKMLHKQYNIEEGTVRDIFCSGADWYKEQCQLHLRKSKQ